MKILSTIEVSSYKKVFFVVFFIFLLFSFFSQTLYAAEYKLQPPVSSYSNTYNLEIPLSGSQTTTTDPGQYIKMIFIFGLGLVGLAALFALAYGGIVYILSAGSAPAQSHAKQWIWGAISGLALLLCSYLILYTINPQLVSLKAPVLEKISIGGGTSPATNTGSSGSPYNLETPLIGSQGTAQTPSDYVRIFFIYALGLVGLAGLFGLVYGGLNYVVSAGSETRKTEGRQWIIGAVSGIALLLCSYLILMTINPQLISLQNPTLETITIPPHTGLNYSNFSSLSDMNAVRSSAFFQDPVIMNALQDAAARYNVPLNIAMFVAGIEHDPGNPYGGISSKGAQGVMQLMPETARLLGVTNPSDPVQNINGGVKYLSQLNQQFNGNWTDTLAAYNAGPARVTQYGGGNNIPFAETQQYLQAARQKGVL